MELMMPTNQENRMERATLDRLLGAATGPSKHCDLCGTWAPGRNIVTEHERREVRLHGCDRCYGSRLYGRLDRSAIAKAAAVRAAIDEGRTLRGTTPDWRAQVASLRSQMDRLRRRPAAHSSQTGRRAATR